MGRRAGVLPLSATPNVLKKSHHDRVGKSTVAITLDLTSFFASSFDFSALLALAFSLPMASSFSCRRRDRRRWICRSNAVGYTAGRDAGRTPGLAAATDSANRTVGADDDARCRATEFRRDDDAIPSVAWHKGDRCRPAVLAEAQASTGLGRTTTSAFIVVDPPESHWHHSDDRGAYDRKPRPGISVVSVTFSCAQSRHCPWDWECFSPTTGARYRTSKTHSSIDHFLANVRAGKYPLVHIIISSACIPVIVWLR